jgi:AraC family transcriptional regulator
MVQLAPLDWHSMTLRASPHFSGPVPASAVSVVDLEDRPQSRLSGRFEAVQFYVPRAALNDLCREQGLAPIGHMVRPRAEPDPLAWQMASLLLPYIHGFAQASPLFVDHVAMAFLAHAARDYGGVDFAGPARPSLTVAQKQRVDDFMRASLTHRLTIEDIAEAIDLRPRHFAASFKKSFGLPPYRYLTQLRIEEAKRLMAASPLSLSDIAMECGFGDQAHFTRVFTRTIGCSPGAWRRLRAA